MLCQSLWQHASAGIRARYGRFELTPCKYSEKRRAYEERQDYSLNNIVTVLDALLPVRELYESSDSTRSVGRALRESSFIGCLLGSEASVGDLDMAFARLGLLPSGYDQCAQEDIYTRFKAGEPLPIIRFLNTALGDSAEELMALSRPMSHRNCEKNIYYYDQSSGAFAVDREVVATYYPLLQSLVRVVEPVVGHA